MLGINPRRLLVLDPLEATFSRRGFRGGGSKRDRFEAIGQHFITGYNTALSASDERALVSDLLRVHPDWQGFAVEGATMALTLTDALIVFRRRLRRFLDLVEDRFLYLACVGSGWALARLPWGTSSITRACPSFFHPLVYDGCGFHDTYFGVRARRDIASSVLRAAYRQGIGRASWFVECADPDALARRVSKAPIEHRADLWAGIGLAAGYAGGATQAELRVLGTAAGPHRRWLAQGAAFAAEARGMALWVPEHTAAACAEFAGRTAAECATIVRSVRNGLRTEDGPAAFAAWRHGVAAEFVEVL